MKPMPYLKRTGDLCELYVDDKPFILLGGELHNSSASSLDYMNEVVWPALRPLGGNGYLAAVAWEDIEPTPGNFDFTLVDGLIDGARREGVRLMLLWFGTWKNGASTYVPHWMKTDEELFYMRDENGKVFESISPFCDKAKVLDIHAYQALMQHIKEYDEEEKTVIAVQVENEVGFWTHIRDFCPQADEAFYAEVPAVVAEHFGVQGNWPTAFGVEACETMMAWKFAEYVGEVTAAGKAIYPLPAFVNTVAGSYVSLAQQASFSPSGAPVPHMFDMWKLMAPAIDWFSPDLYGGDFRSMATHYTQKGNPLFIPELGSDANATGKLFFAVGELGCIGFSPFGIDGAMAPLSSLDLASQGFGGGTMHRDMRPLAEAYHLVDVLWDEIVVARREGRIHGFMQQNDMDTTLRVAGALMKVKFQSETDPGSMGLPFSGPKGKTRPHGSSVPGGFVIERPDGELLICGVNCSVEFEAEIGSQETVWVMDKREMLLKPEGLVECRLMNGDERDFGNDLGPNPTIFTIRLYSRKD